MSEVSKQLRENADLPRGRGLRWLLLQAAEEIERYEEAAIDAAQFATMLDKAFEDDRGTTRGTTSHEKVPVEQEENLDL